MKYILLLMVSISVFSACGKKAQEENAIPVLKTEKARKAKLHFDLTEVIRKEDKLDLIIMISNKGNETMISYLREELAFTDNNGYIYKANSAKINHINQFGSQAELAKIPKASKVKSVISFNEVRKDATSGRLFFKGETKRDKTTPFRVEFTKVKLVN